MVYKEGIQFFIVFDVSRLLTVFNFVERRLGDIDMSSLNEFRHLTVEKCQQQSADMSTVHVSIGHDDDTVITQLIQIKFVTDAGA